MSKLIKAMIKELLSNKGKEIDRTIMSNVETSYRFNPRLVQPNCLTSLFMLNVKRSPKLAFLKDLNEQEGYDNAQTRKTMLADAKALSDGFDDKTFQKAHKKSTTIESFIDAINDDKGGFKQKYGNELFIKALNDVKTKMPNENFTVQLLCALSQAKMEATSQEDILKLVDIEASCKPFVYADLSRSSEFKTQQELQDKVLGYFGKRNLKALDYFRLLSIANIIKTKLANEVYFNTNVNEVDSDNSLLFIDAFGAQRYLINGNDNEPAVNERTKITDIVKNCYLYGTNGASHNSKYIQKALLRINDEVNALNGTEKSIQDKDNFLQTAIAFMLLFDAENVQDPYDFIGVSLANPVSDIIEIMNENHTDLEQIVKNAFNVANNIYRKERGKALSDASQSQQAQPDQQSVQQPDQQTSQQPQPTVNSQDDKNKKKRTSRARNVQRQAQGQSAGTRRRTAGNPPVRITPATPDNTKKNIRFYQNITKSLVKVLSKDLNKFVALNEKITATGKLTKKQQEEYDRLSEVYTSPSHIREMIDDIKVMHSDMEFLSSKMVSAIKKDQDLQLNDTDRSDMSLSEEQNEKNAERFEQYTAYYQFVKGFDNSRRLTMVDIARFMNDPDSPLKKMKILRYLPAPVQRQQQAQQSADVERENS